MNIISFFGLEQILSQLWVFYCNGRNFRRKMGVKGKLIFWETLVRCSSAQAQAVLWSFWKTFYIYPFFPISISDVFILNINPLPLHIRININNTDFPWCWVTETNRQLWVSELVFRDYMYDIFIVIHWLVNSEIPLCSE